MIFMSVRTIIEIASIASCLYIIVGLIPIGFPFKESIFMDFDRGAITAATFLYLVIVASSPILRGDESEFMKNSNIAIFSAFSGFFIIFYLVAGYGDIWTKLTLSVPGAGLAMNVVLMRLNLRPSKEMQKINRNLKFSKYFLLTMLIAMAAVGLMDSLWNGTNENSGLFELLAFIIPVGWYLGMAHVSWIGIKGELKKGGPRFYSDRRNSQ